MKKFGLPALLSAGYVGILCLVFTTDFARENTFLKHDLVEKKSGKTIFAKVSSEMPSVKTRILMYSVNSFQPTQGGNSGDMQSAEGAFNSN